MRLSGISKKVFLDRYSLKNPQGKPTEKKPEAMWHRVAKAVAAVEKKENRKKWEKVFYQAMKNFTYVPAGRVLAGAGSHYAVTYYNCFVIPSPKDSREGILETLKQMVEIMARGGGVGINFSSLRPRGARVKKVNGSSSGPINWAELFSVATKEIIQQGGSRRGALMLMLWDWHPDIEEFITVKENLTKINGANLSIAISNKFMEAVKKNADWPLVFPDLNDPEYDQKWNGDLTEWKKMGKKVIVKKVVKARKIWNLIAKAAWQSAEPGVVFMERYNQLNNNYYWTRINSVNPCGEEGLPPWGVCNLGSINLSTLVKSKNINEKGKFDYRYLKKLVRVAVHFQDNLIEMDPYFFKGIREMQLNGERRIGIGTMGLGDALIKMHLRYGSPQSLKVIDKIYKTIRNEAYRESIKIAAEKGSFPKFDKNKYIKGQFIQTLPKKIQEEIKRKGIRNSLLLMQAPTGSTSLMSGVTSGIEPVFEFEFVRKDRLGTHIIKHPLWEAWLKKNKGKKKPAWFVSANELSPEEHVSVQATIQKYVDASISKTVNAPKTHTIEDVKKLYTLAFDSGLKGIAYMRSGSRPGVLERKEKKEDKPIQKTWNVKPRPMVVHGATYRINTPVGVAFITINTNGGNPPEPLEIFINVGKAGTDLYAMATALGRSLSLALRFSSHLSPTIRIKEIIDQLDGIGGAHTLGFGKERIRSLPDAVARVLKIHYHLDGQGEPMVVKKNKETAKLVNQTTQPGLIQSKMEENFDICPACGEVSLVYEEGCKKCYNCGYSEC